MQYKAFSKTSILLCIGNLILSVYIHIYFILCTLALPLGLLHVKLASNFQINREEKGRWTAV